jgi:hypothetical protein
VAVDLIAHGIEFVRKMVVARRPANRFVALAVSRFAKTHAVSLEESHDELSESKQPD